MNTEEKFREIYRKYMPILRVLAKKGGIPYDEIDDVVQDTFAAFYSHYPLTWPNYKIKAMLVRIMKNRCVDYLRRRERIHIISYDPVMMQEDMFTTEELCESDNLSILMDKLEYQDVMNALKELRSDWSAVIELYVIEGRPMDEVSRILKISEAACRQRLCRGRKQLKQILSQAEERRQAKDKNAQSLENRISDNGEIPENA